MVLFSLLVAGVAAKSLAVPWDAERSGACPGRRSGVVGAAGLWSGILRSPSGRSNGAEETGREGWTDGLTGLSRNGCLPAARNTSGGVYPGRGVEE